MNERDEALHEQLREDEMVCQVEESEFEDDQLLGPAPLVDTRHEPGEYQPHTFGMGVAW